MNIVSAANYSLRKLTDLFNRGFEGYVVPIELTEEIFAFLCAYSLVDFHRSLVAEIDGQPAGLLLLGSRGWTMRGAAMGIVTEHRGKGVGTALINRSIEDSRAAGFRSMILEVLDPNEPAIHVYKKCGFNVSRKLIGWERPRLDDPAPGATLTEIDPYQFALAVARYGVDHLPWMSSVEFYAAFQPGLSKAYSIDDQAFILIMPKSDELGRISGIVVAPEHRRQGLGSALLNGIFALYPGRHWEMIPVFPEDATPEFFQHHQFVRPKINQFEMEISLV